MRLAERAGAEDRVQDGGFTETWDGTAWTLESSPNSGNDSILQGVSCASSQVCTAAGMANDEGGVQTTLIETGG